MLRDMMESILKNSDTVLGVEWKSGPNSSELLLGQEDGRGRMVFHPLFPGVTLAFIQVNASNWPESEANAELREAKGWGLYTFMIGIPVAFLVVGVVVFFKRRHL